MAGQANDSEKLPWLEPYREPAAPARKARPPKRETVDRAMSRGHAPKPRRGVPLAAWLVAGIAVVGLAAGGGYWAGNRQSPSPAPSITIPVAKVDPIPMPEVVAEATPQIAPRANGTSARRGTRGPAPARKATVRRATRPSEPPAPPAAAPPMPKAMVVRYSAPPSAAGPGAVVDLGRYLSPTLADSAYRATVGRYPYLSRLTKVVAPQPVFYGQPRLYALQLGARTPREARQLCDNLKKIGRPCVVR